MKRMSTFLAIANQKGGVAKTTNTINIAGALSKRGFDVLVVDTDPQGYLSRILGFLEEYNTEEPNLSDAFNDPMEFELGAFVREHAEFDVVPSSVDMFMVQQELIASGWKPRERLTMLFDTVDPKYDFVLVDAPPSLGVINDNVLVATGSMILPVEAHETSIHALDILLSQIETLEERYDVRITQEAVVISNVNYPLDNNQKEMIEYFEDTFDGRCPVHEVRHRAAVKRSLHAGGSVFGDDAERTDMTDNYLDIATDLESLQEVAPDA